MPLSKQANHPDRLVVAVLVGGRRICNDERECRAKEPTTDSSQAQVTKLWRKRNVWLM